MCSMQNVNMTVKGNKLLIEVDTSQELNVSATGKSMVVATTGGNVPAPNMPDVKIGLNVYKPTKQGTAAVIRDLKNVKFTVKGAKMIMEVDLTGDFGLSGSGKSVIVASSSGNTAVEGLAEIRVGLNVYKPVKPGQPIQTSLV